MWYFLQTAEYQFKIIKSFFKYDVSSFNGLKLFSSHDTFTQSTLPLNVEHRTAAKQRKAPLAVHLLAQLECVDVQQVFYVPGGQIDGLVNAMLQDRRLPCFMAVHEAGAAFMADGACRSSGKPSAALSIGGPGAGNMITAAMTAAADRAPIIFITGEVPTFLQGMGAFQHNGPDGSFVRRMFEAAGCLSFQISQPSDLIKACRSFKGHIDSGKSRPMHLSIPCDLAMTDMPEPDPGFELKDFTEQHLIHLFEKKSCNSDTGHRSISKAALWIGKDIPPADLKTWQSITGAYRIPVIATMESSGYLADFDETLRCGVFGYAGHPEAYDLMCDPELELLIIHGVEFNERNTWLWSSSIWHPDRRVIVIGSEALISWPAPLDLATSIHTSVSNAMKIITDGFTEIAFQIAQDHKSPKSSYSFIRDRYTSIDHLTDDNLTSLTLAGALERLCDVIPPNMHVFTDAGDHRYFTSFIFSRKPHRYLHGAAQTAPMGWAIGAGIGAGLSRPEIRSLVITGDGCMLMHGMETATAVRYQASVTFLLVDNGSYGKISRRFSAMGHTGTDHPGMLAEVDWPLFCQAVAMPFAIIADMQELMPAWEASMNCSGPFIIILKVSPDEPYPNPASVFSSTIPSFIDHCQQNIKSSGWPLKNIPS